MTKMFRFFFKTIVFILLLLLLVVLGLYFYGEYITADLEKKNIEVKREALELDTAGNGFGRDLDFKILDSALRPERFFWKDNKNLIYTIRKKDAGGKVGWNNYIWNITLNTIKPLDIDGGIVAYSNGKLRYTKLSEAGVLPNGNRAFENFESEIFELENNWVLGKELNLDEGLKPPSPRYELSWVRGGRPWFRLKNKERNEGDSPRHKFLYLWEWGWILRKPWSAGGKEIQRTPEMGFFDIDHDIYYGQEGQKVAEMIDLPPLELSGLKVVYIGFLDKYWIANTVYGGSAKVKLNGFLSRNGSFKKLHWPRNWIEYTGIPLPTRKGIFWSGRDFREEKPAKRAYGAYIKDANNQIHRVIIGSVLRSVMSNDGCRVAFVNSPLEHDRSNMSLKVFNVCESMLKEEELNDVKY